MLYYLIRRVIPFKDMTDCLPEGFKSMVPAILILVFAWSLKAMTDSLGAKEFVEQLVRGSATGFQSFLPAIIFLIAWVCLSRRERVGVHSVSLSRSRSEFSL